MGVEEFMATLIVTAIIIAGAIMVFSSSDEPPDSNSLGIVGGDGAYILKSDPITYMQSALPDSEEVILVMMVPIDRTRSNPFEYETTDKTRIPEVLKKGDVVVKSKNGLRKIEIEIEIEIEKKIQDE